MEASYRSTTCAPLPAGESLVSRIAAITLVRRAFARRRNVDALPLFAQQPFQAHGQLEGRLRQGSIRPRQGRQGNACIPDVPRHVPGRHATAGHVRHAANDGRQRGRSLRPANGRFADELVDVPLVAAPDDAPGSFPLPCDWHPTPYGTRTFAQRNNRRTTQLNSRTMASALPSMHFHACGFMQQQQQLQAAQQAELQRCASISTDPPNGTATLHITRFRQLLDKSLDFAAGSSR
jgi:hypothetical protein